MPAGLFFAASDRYADTNNTNILENTSSCPKAQCQGEKCINESSVKKKRKNLKRFISVETKK